MVNPIGAQIVFDGEVPRTFTALTRAVVSGGQLVVFSGTANSVGSAVNTYSASDVIVDTIQDSNRCNGIALHNAGSNTYVTVATRGAYLVRCAGVVSGGYQVIPVSGTTPGVGIFGQTGSPDYSLTGTPIGRAMITSASGTSLFTLVSLNV